jgi:NADH-quinone oxidoreductase subunit L
MIAGWLAISGVPPLAGFFSKEAIIGSALSGHHGTVDGVQWAVISGWIALGVAFLTAVYMTRLTSLTFFGKEERWRSLPAAAHDGQEHLAIAEESPALADDRNGFFHAEPVLAEEPPHHELHAGHEPREVPPSMWIPLVILAVLSVGAGLLLNGKFEHWLYPDGLPILGEVPHEATGVPLMALSIAAALGGLLVGWFFYGKGLPKDQGFDESKWRPWRRGAREQFGFDYVVTTGAIDGGGDVARAMHTYVDRNLIDGIINGLAGFTTGVGGLLKRLQTGYVRLYALVMLIGLVAFIGYFAIVAGTLGGGK